MKHIDNLTYKTFVNKFNDTYAESLRKEQRDLLTNFIISFSDNGVGLKSFINEEIHRLRSSLQTLNEGAYAQNASKVVDKLESFKERRLDEQMLRDLFYIQDLVHEVTKNGINVKIGSAPAPQPRDTTIGVNINTSPKIGVTINNPFFTRLNLN